MFFDEKTKQNSGHGKYQDKNALMAKMKVEQDRRKLEKQQQEGATLIQRYLRGLAAA
jgi:hypothetical protein